MEEVIRCHFAVEVPSAVHYEGNGRQTFYCAPRVDVQDRQDRNSAQTQAGAFLFTAHKISQFFFQTLLLYFRLTPTLESNLANRVDPPKRRIGGRKVVSKFAKFSKCKRIKYLVVLIKRKISNITVLVCTSLFCLFFRHFAADCRFSATGRSPAFPTRSLKCPEKWRGTTEAAKSPKRRHCR